MHATTRPFSGAAIPLVLCVMLLPPAEVRAAETKCPSGTTPATAEDLSSMRAAGIPNPTVGMCWKRGDTITGKKVAAAKAFLISRYVIGPRSAPCIKTKEQGIGPLHPEFAVRVARMIQDMEYELGGRNIVRSAYRPKACGGGIGHSGGCAVDIEWAHSGGWRGASDNPNVPETKWVRERGGDPKYGIHFPFPYPPEWHHIEPTDRGSCLAGRTIDPSIAGVQTSPTSKISDSIRDFFGLGKPAPAAATPAGGAGQSTGQPTAQPPPQPPPLTGQNTAVLPPGTCAPQNYCADGAIYYRYSDCRDELVERCEHGCAGVACNVSPSGVSGTLASALSTSTATSSPTPPPSPQSAIQGIADIAGPSSEAVGQSSSDPLVLTIGADDAVRIQDDSGGATAVQSDDVPLPPRAAQTFTSQDLSMTPEDPRVAAERSALEAILLAARETLTYILAYLRPFGRPYDLHSDI